ncbi:MAG: FkbM family methyltransferase [Candidatus Lokiarchaeota archaeon]|nr:FkbM family methyltransferase [Candidatus Lokiarchaeota archaeon]
MYNQIGKIRRFIFELIRKSPMVYQIRELTNKLIKILKKFKIYIPIKRFIFNKITTLSQETIDFFSQFIDKGDLCFDIGAWEGELVQIFLKLGAKIVAVEPQERCVEKLQIYFGNNENVKIYQKALGEKHDFGKIALCDNKTQLSSLSSRFVSESRFANRCKWTKHQPIEIITLDSLIQKYGVPKFCKIDVEGYEKNVLKGLSHPIQYLSFEYIEEFSDVVKECCDMLSNIGEVRFNIIQHSGESLIFEKWLETEEFLNQLSSNKYNISSGDIYANFI